MAGRLYERGEADAAALSFATQAHVRATGEATDDDLMALIRKKAPNPEVFNDNPPFVWTAESSNTGLDSYFTRMHDSSLRNYAKDADAGVMFLDSHDKRQLGFGQSVRGQFLKSEGRIDDKDPAGEVSRVLIDFFTLPGVSLGRADTDSFIKSVQSGIIRDVSIGFIPGEFECNLCRNDPYDWWSMECMHIPGAYYDSTGKNVVNEKSQGAIQAFAWVKNARLSEVSAVFDGATPGAYIQKAHFLADNGEVSRASAAILERQIGTNLLIPAKYNIPEVPMSGGNGRFRRLAGGNDDPDGGDGRAADPATAEAQAEIAQVRGQLVAAESQLSAVRRALATAGVKDAETVDIAEAISGMSQRIATLEPRAKLGDEWRERVVNEALDAGVRALGASFKREDFAKSFEAMGVNQIELMRDSWEAMVTLPKNGRKTADVDTAAPSVNGAGRQSDLSQFRV